MSNDTGGAHISRETFNHLVDLAELELNEEQSAYLLQQMNAQLEAVRELGSIPLGDAAPGSTHGVAYLSETRPALRADEVQSFADPSAIVAQSPQHEAGYIAAPDIPHTTLD